MWVAICFYVGIKNNLLGLMVLDFWWFFFLNKGNPLEILYTLEIFPADYLRSLTYWIVRTFFPVSFGFVIISAIEIIRRKYFQLRKIANRKKRNSFFDIQERIPDPCYTRLNFLADMNYACHHRSTAVILLLNIYWLKAKCRCKLGNWESKWKFFRKRNPRGTIHVNHLQVPCLAFLW